MGVETITYDGRPITASSNVRPDGWQMFLATGGGYQINLGNSFEADDLHRYYADFQKQFGYKPASMVMGFKAFARMKELADGK
jgi:hypothetical protein